MDLDRFGTHGQEVEVQTLADKKHAGEPDVSNSFADPERIAPTHSVFHASSAHFTYHFPPYSLTVLRWKVTEP
jgi:alpha-L-arabinofuranosidase